MNDNASADNYRYVVGQVKGTRTAIPINDGSAYTPTDFDLYTDEACTNKATDVEVTVGDYNTQLYFAYTPAVAFISFLDLDIEVTDKAGNAAQGIMVTLNGNVVALEPNVAGEYVVTFTAGNIVKTVNIMVAEQAKRGEKSFEIVLSECNYILPDFEIGGYTFVAPKRGEYTFYLPVGVGVQLYDKETEEYYFAYDYNDHPYRLDDPIPEGTYSWTVTLRNGEAYNMIFMVRVKNTPYTIGYDEP